MNTNFPESLSEAEARLVALVSRSFYDVLEEYRLDDIHGEAPLMAAWLAAERARIRLPRAVANHVQTSPGVCQPGSYEDDFRSRFCLRS